MRSLPTPLVTPGLRAAALAAAVTLLLGACSGASHSATSEAAQAPGAPAGLNGAAGAGAAGAASGAAGSGAGAQDGAQSVQSGQAGGKAGGAGGGTTSNAAAQAKQRLIRTMELTIEVKDNELSTAAARVRQAAIDLGGFVSSETAGYAADAKPITVTGPDGQPTQRAAAKGQDVVVVRVPEPDLDKFVTRIGGTALGKELSRTADSKDVTGSIADLTSRVSTQKASVARIRELLAKANSLQDITYLEAELTKREADLESYEAQLAALADRADLATATVVLQTPQVEPPPAPASDNGFLQGLKAGWNAVVASTTIVLTVLGALLPLAIVLLLVGGPIWLITRRARRNRPTVPPTTAGHPSGDQAPVAAGDRG